MCMETNDTHGSQNQKFEEIESHSLHLPKYKLIVKANIHKNSVTFVMNTN